MNLMEETHLCCLPASVWPLLLRSEHSRSPYYDCSSHARTHTHMHINTNIVCLKTPPCGRTNRQWAICNQFCVDPCNVKTVQVDCALFSSHSLRTNALFTACIRLLSIHIAERTAYAYVVWWVKKIEKPVNGSVQIDSKKFKKIIIVKITVLVLNVVLVKRCWRLLWSARQVQRKFQSEEFKTNQIRWWSVL